MDPQKSMIIAVLILLIVAWVSLGDKETTRGENTELAVPSPQSTNQPSSPEIEVRQDSPGPGTPAASDDPYTFTDPGPQAEPGTKYPSTPRGDIAGTSRETSLESPKTSQNPKSSPESRDATAPAPTEKPARTPAPSRTPTPTNPETYTRTTTPQDPANTTPTTTNEPKTGETDDPSPTTTITGETYDIAWSAPTEALPRQIMMSINKCEKSDAGKSSITVTVKNPTSKPATNLILTGMLLNEDTNIASGGKKQVNIATLGAGGSRQFTISYGSVGEWVYCTTSMSKS
ncbi:hypothetical protein ACFLRF_00400 [Candidatus Altiarchaeota archaeon]